MASNTQRTLKKDVNEHPKDSILLAYLREQKLEDHVSISRHIDVEKCPRCCHKLSELKQVSTTLDVLGQMQSYQHYPELSVADTYARVQREASKQAPAQSYLRGANNRQRPRRSAVRLISLPAAFGLAILFTVAMLVFANLPGKSWISGSVQGGISHSSGNTTVVVIPHSTPTSDLNLTATEGPTSSVTPTRTYIKICLTPTDIAQFRLVICGHNFEAGHKVLLVATFATLAGRTFTIRHVVTVDKQGNFQGSWYVYNCRYQATAISASEIDNPQSFSATLENIAFPGCALTPTAGS
jgi:hypothetical protein